MSLINIIVLSFKLLVDCWDVFVYGRGWPHASQVCCDIQFLGIIQKTAKVRYRFYLSGYNLLVSSPFVHTVETFQHRKLRLCGIKKNNLNLFFNVVTVYSTEPFELKVEPPSSRFGTRTKPPR